MERGDEAIGAHDAALECVLSVWLEPWVVARRHPAKLDRLFGEADAVDGRDCHGRDRQRQTAAFPRAGTVGGRVCVECRGDDFDVSVLREERGMFFWENPQFGDKMITL